MKKLIRFLRILWSPTLVAYGDVIARLKQENQTF